MADPELAGMELLKHATQSWTPRAHVNGDLIGSTDVLAIVERQACHLDTWMINPSFRDNYPEFANCRIVYAS
jgi:hypothetical protein